MNSTLKKRTINVLIGIILLILLLPGAFITTIMTFPFWRWFEKVTGFESYGHSGPAEWCYWLIYFLLIFITGILRYMKMKDRTEDKI